MLEEISSASLLLELNSKIATGIGSILPCVMSILSSAKIEKGKKNNKNKKCFINIIILLNY